MKFNYQLTGTIDVTESVGGSFGPGVFRIEIGRAHV